MTKNCILIVEDDRDIREELIAVLEENDYCVLVADHGLHALELLRAGNRPDAIILDLMMPVMDGWEFREAQIRDPELACIPVIVTTASERTVPANALLRKPIDREKLLRVLAEHTRRN
ncbi:MAG TPA: response regulator [Myxococcales bacterium]|nr:response regulator [Myxococcales bacterium]